METRAFPSFLTSTSSTVLMASTTGLRMSGEDPYSPSRSCRTRAPTSSMNTYVSYTV
jgi:hypothetical protein